MPLSIAALPFSVLVQHLCELFEGLSLLELDANTLLAGQWDFTLTASMSIDTQFTTLIPTPIVFL